MVGKVGIGGAAAVMVGTRNRDGDAAARQARQGTGTLRSIAGSSPARPTPAAEAASGFLTWLREHDLCREWTVDDVWYLAEADFAEALDVELPPRRVFLGELQKLAGVRVTYDRRLYDRTGRPVRKTTFYAFSARPEPNEQPEMNVAA